MPMFSSHSFILRYVYFSLPIRFIERTNFSCFVECGFLLYRSWKWIGALGYMLGFVRQSNCSLAFWLHIKRKRAQRALLYKATICHRQRACVAWNNPLLTLIFHRRLIFRLCAHQFSRAFFSSAALSFFNHSKRFTDSNAPAHDKRKK